MAGCLYAASSIRELDGCTLRGIGIFSAGSDEKKRALSAFRE